MNLSMNSILTETDCQKEAVIFLDTLFDDLKNEKVELQEYWDIDHLCYRCESLESYEKLKSDFSSFAKLLIESPINGRLISTFKLKKPIQYRDYLIDLIELPAPKKGKLTVNGFEHAEIVCDWSFQKIKNHFSHVDFDESGSQKNINAELEICLKRSNLKFHHLSLESVIQLESNSRLWPILEELNILNSLAELHPMIAGTFPLDIYTEKSDVDILLQSHDLSLAIGKLKELFENFEEFEIQEMLVKTIPTVLCRFVFKGLNFEIFTQELEVLEQDAYQHFLIEEKILKRAGDDFKKRIIEAKQKDLKTEPAFAEMLQIEDCPYAALKKMQKRPLHFLKTLKYS